MSLVSGLLHTVTDYLTSEAGGSFLGWRFRTRTDSIEGRIRADSGGCDAVPQRETLRNFTVCMDSLTLQKWVPDSDGVDGGSESGRFGWIPITRKWNQPTQGHSERRTRPTANLLLLLHAPACRMHSAGKSSPCFPSAAKPPVAELGRQSYFRNPGTLYVTEITTVYAG
jgi:hypothetical protein